jgi:endonuclease/exonuclease/phosphatase family metal-dependent hydrolase
MKRIAFIWILCSWILTGFSQQTISLMSYNILNYDNASSSRSPYFKMIIDSLNPDILVVQEIIYQSGVDLFYSTALNSSYTAGQFLTGFDTQNAIFFKNSVFSFISNNKISTAHRDINEFTMRHIGTGDTLLIYAVHLKSSTGTINEDKRAAEIGELRWVTNALNYSQHFIVCGDFNIYSASEQAYMDLTTDDGTTSGHVIDPFNMPGTWNNSNYAQFHTQCPRTRSFGGGSTGGMDDRFDMILYSQSIADANAIDYVSGSTWAVGNDGNHYNDSINQPPNTSCSQNFANALHYAADHLPVIATFEFNNPLSVEEGYDPGSIKIFPNPATTQLSITAVSKETAIIEIIDLLGRTVLEEMIDCCKTSVNIGFLGKGSYIVRVVQNSITSEHLLLKR